MHKIQKTIRRRRKQGKTDYRARFSLLKSELPRLVVRKTNRYIVAQIIETEVAQDKIVLGVTSKDLIKYGWPEEKIGSLKNLGAAYLTGFLIGKKYGKNKKIILDIGLHRNIKKGRLYAVLNGAVDAGLDIPHSEEALPGEMLKKEDRNLNLIEKVKEKIKNG